MNKYIVVGVTDYKGGELIAPEYGDSLIEIIGHNRLEYFWDEEITIGELTKHIDKTFCSPYAGRNDIYSIYETENLTKVSEDEIKKIDVNLIKKFMEDFIKENN